MKNDVKKAVYRISPLLMDKSYSPLPLTMLITNSKLCRKCRPLWKQQ